VRRVYLAARFERQDEVSELAREFRRAGYVVTSSWHEQHGAAAVPLDLDRAHADAVQDLAEIELSDTVVLMTDDVPGRGGKDFEAGYAYAAGRQLIVLGPRTNVFCFLREHTQRVPDVATLRFLYLEGEKIDDIP